MASRSKSREIRVYVKQVAVHEEKRAVVVLGTRTRGLDIWIGPFEAHAIEQGRRGARFGRPLTHDLLVTALVETDYQIEKMVITKIENSTFIGELHLSRGKKRGPVLDCRPSDGIALALRAKAPIYVSEPVMAQAGCSLGQAEKRAEDLRAGRIPALPDVRKWWLDLLGHFADPEGSFVLKSGDDKPGMVPAHEKKPAEMIMPTAHFKHLAQYICRRTGLTKQPKGKRARGTVRFRGKEGRFEIKVSAYMPKRGLPKSIQVDAHRL